MMGYTLSYSDAILIYFLIVTKIIPKFVTFTLDKYFGVELSIKSVSLFDFCIRGIKFKYADIELVVGEFGLRSKFFNSTYPKAICVCVDDVKIVGSGDGAVLESIEKIRKYKDVVEDGRNSFLTSEIFIKILGYLRYVLPPTAMISLQYLGVYITHFNTTVLNKEQGPAVSLAIPKIQLIFDGCYVKDSRKLFTAIRLQHVRPKVYAFNKQNPQQKQNNSCLAEVVIDVKLETCFSWESYELIFEKLELMVSDTQITFYGGLFDIIEHFMLHTKLHETMNSPKLATSKTEFSDKINSMVEVTKEGPPAADTLDVAKLMKTLTPSILKIRVDNTEIKSLDKHNSYHYHLLLHHIEVKSEKFKLSSSSSFSHIRISNLRIYTPDNEVLYAKDVIVDARMLSDGVVSVGARVDSANCMYIHEDIYGWFRKIILAGVKSNRKELILRAFEIMHEMNIQLIKSQFVQDIFDGIIVNLFLELNNSTLIIQLDDPRVSSLNVAKVKFNLRQTASKIRQTTAAYENILADLIFRQRHWAFEVVNQGQFCWYLGRKFDYFTKKGTYMRGSVLYAQNAFISLSSIDNEETSMKIFLRANTARLEYSSKLTYYVVQSIINIREFIDLFGKLKHDKNEGESDASGGVGEQKDPEVSDMEEVKPKKFLLDLQAEDVSLFFINRHEVCIFFTMSQVTSYDLKILQLDSLHIATVDFTKCDSIYDLNELSTTHVSTQRLIVKFSAPDGQIQMEIDFNQTFDVMWNAHCLRHWMSIVRDIRRFVRKIKVTCGIQTSSFRLPRRMPLGLDIKKIRNIAIKHSDCNVENFLSFLGDITNGNLFFYQYFN